MYNLSKANRKEISQGGKVLETVAQEWIRIRSWKRRRNLKAQDQGSCLAAPSAPSNGNRRTTSALKIIQCASSGLDDCGGDDVPKRRWMKLAQASRTQHWLPSFFED
ncbi:hypothetical protein LshimejAT787_2400010 [Lyophyllum shimeji]|uniref:Uncharacterized protein n=1 Tax=Lyophyllum shimeji TaxID=47721 RepID=A0A9P3Q1S9_LYOSH|nr:hypothetical protein LshimejAT787_2400010 [Lyophyllum shimeji]